MKTKFFVLNWDFNKDCIVPYDVLPYFRDQLNTDSQYMMLSDKECFKKFIVQKSRNNFWARAEYEVIVESWPPTQKSMKIDIHEQIMWNIDTITNILYREYFN